MVNDYLDEPTLGKKKKEPKTLRFKNTQEAFSYYTEKERQKKIRSDVQARIKRLQRIGSLRKQFGSAGGAVVGATQDIGASIGQSQKREGIIRAVGSRAEAIERQICSMSEVPLLHNMERARMEILTVKNKWLENVEKSVTDSFPS